MFVGARIRCCWELRTGLQAATLSRCADGGCAVQVKWTANGSGQSLMMPLLDNQVGKESQLLASLEVRDARDLSSPKDADDPNVCER